MDEQLIALYHRHVATAFDRQLRMADYLARKVPGEKGEYAAATATLSFGKLKFEAPLVGTHSDQNNSWLWAWSNKNLKLTITNRALGDAVRATVHRLGLHALAAPGFFLEPLLGPDLTEHAAHILGMILGSELGYDAYYLSPHDGGRDLVLVRDDRLKFAERQPLRRILRIFPQVITSMPVFDHRAAFTNYARDYGLTVTEEPHVVRAASGKDSLTANFDALGRLATLEGTVPPEEAAKLPAKVPPKKPAAKAVKRPATRAAAKPAKKAAPKPAKKPAAKKPGKKR